MKDVNLGKFLESYINYISNRCTRSRLSADSGEFRQAIVYFNDTLRSVNGLANLTRVASHNNVSFSFNDIAESQELQDQAEKIIQSTKGYIYRKIAEAN